MDSGNQFLGTERMGRLMRQYAIPCIISLLMGALYNIVDQIFIANASYLGSYGNAGYRQVLCANSFTSLAELSLHRAGKPALNYLVAEDRERVKGGEAACEALDVSSVFCYQPASSSCISMCFMLMYFFPPHWVPAT